MSLIPVRISGDGFSHKVEVDGHEVQRGTMHLSLEIDAKERVPVLTLRLLVAGLDAETAALVRLDDETAEALKAIGWTPPAGDA